MNTRIDSTTNLVRQQEPADFQFPAGAGLALAVLLGSVFWLGIFALIM